MRTWAVIGLLSLGLSACGEKKKAALERFLGSAQQERQTNELAGLDAFAFENDPKLQDSILFMGFPEAARRLGAHRFQAQIDFSFESAERKVKLAESDLILVAQNGDQSVKVENDASQGYEILFLRGRTFLRNRYGVLHEIDRLSGEFEGLRDSAYGGWAAVVRLFRGQLGFTKTGVVKHFGREAVKYAVGLNQGGPRLPGTLHPPEVPTGITKYVYPIQPTPTDKDAWRDKAEPKEARGTVLVDTKSGALLGVDFHGRLGFVTSSAGEGFLQVAVQLKTDGFGNPASLSLPPENEIKPIPSRAEVDTRPLDPYFHKGFTSTLGPPAGVAGRKPNEEEKTDASPPGPEGNEE